MFKSKKALLILCFLLFLLLMFLCVCSKIDSIYSAVHSKSSNVTITKQSSKVVVDGIFGNEHLAKRTVEKFKMFNDDVEEGDIETNDNIKSQEDKWSQTLDNIAYYFSSSFENAKLTFADNVLKIDGEVISKEAKDDVLSSLDELKLKGINVEEKISLLEPKNDTQKMRRDLYGLMHSKTVEFETEQATIKSESYFLLDSIAKTLQAYPDAKISIEGHTDDLGEDEFNQKLSEDRANSVKNYLVAKGVDGDRLSTMGFGEYRPAFPNTTKGNRQKNRRVEFKVKGE